MTKLVYTIVSILYSAVIAHDQGSSFLTANKNPVHDGELVILTCVLQADRVTVLSVMVDGRRNTQKLGALYCKPTTGSTYNSTGVGLFSGHTLDGCLFFDSHNPSLRVSIIASSSWDLDYMCTFKVFDSASRTAQYIISSLLHLSVIGKPDVRKKISSPIVFNDLDSAVVICESHHGQPPALVTMKIRSPERNPNSAPGTDSAAVNYSVSLPWHNAVVFCNLSSKNAFEMTPAIPVIISYITAPIDTYFGVNTRSSNKTIDCSADISRFPSRSYMRIPIDENSAHTPHIPERFPNFFVCIAVSENDTIAIATRYGVTNELISAINSIIWLLFASSTIVVGIPVTGFGIQYIFIRYLKRKPSKFKMDGQSQGTRNESRSSEQSDDSDPANESGYQSLKCSAGNEQPYEHLL